MRYAIIQQLAEASFGLFKPTRIKDSLDAKARTATIRFSLGKKSFSHTVPYKNEWFEREVVDVLIDNALAETGVAHRFHALPTTDQTIAFAFVPDKVWDEAIARGILTAERVPPQHVPKVCDAKLIASRLPPKEGMAGLKEWASEMRTALIAECRAQDYARIRVTGLGQFGARPGRTPDVRTPVFMADQTLKNAANSDATPTKDLDDVVTVIVGLLREGYNTIELPDIGTLKVTGMEAGTMRGFDGNSVEMGARNVINFIYAPKLLAEITKPAH